MGASTLLTQGFVPGLLASAAAPAFAVHGPDDVPTWARDVRPILGEHCLACHGPDPESRAAGLRLDTREGMIAGDVLDFDEPAESELLYRVTTDSEFDHMPPAESGRSLHPGEIDVLSRWVEAGAQWEPHWAYAPFEPLASGGAPDSIDAFVGARLKAEGLDFAPEAPPRDLLRRLWFDLAGMPPSHGDVAAFEEDPSGAAYEAHVERLLGSVDFAEHWARHWLDLARYADSHGYTIDGGRTIWPWRDWVVEAIHQDMPFDQFTVEQLAGDLLPGATRDQRIATGFHRNTQVNQEGGAKDEENRINAVIDRVATTGSIWLGSSVACAQCHTHKFDPITHTDYFRLFAFFNSTVDGGVSSEPSLLVPSTDEEAAAATEWERNAATLLERYLDAWNGASGDWQVWQPAKATGSNGPELRPEITGAYRVLGQNPVYSTYVLEGPVSGLESVSSLRLEVLPDGGPGRGGRNFVLQELRVATREPGAEAWTEHPVTAARADFEQDTSAQGGGAYPAASLVTGAEGDGWAIKPAFDSPHVLELDLGEPVALEGRELRLELSQEFGSNHTIGHFRMLLSGDADRDRSADLVPEAWSDAWLELHRARRARPNLPRTLVLQERRVPRKTRRFERGSFLDQREEVAPGFPEALDHFSPPGVVPTTRLDLARWLVDPRNALVHRVTVNRFWQQLFGSGLVATEDDFGLRGARPSHPALLEWLAQDYVASGMSRKHVLRRIVLSRTYRQGAAPDAERVAADPSARLLSYGQSRRLPGEVLRDSMLTAAGSLDRTVGGRPVQPPQPAGVFAFTQSRKNWSPSPGSQRFRRSLYTRIWRSSPFPFFSTFDAPSPGFTCTRRGVSSNPLQALALANDPMVMEIAGVFGERLTEARSGGSMDSAVELAFRLALGRDPSSEETAVLTGYAASVAAKRDDRAAMTAVARVLFNLAEFTHRP